MVEVKDFHIKIATIFHTSLPTLEKNVLSLWVNLFKALDKFNMSFTFMDKLKQIPTLSATNPQFPPYLVPPDASQKSAKLTEPWPAPGFAIINASQDLKLGVAVTTVDGRNRAPPGMSETL